MDLGIVDSKTRRQERMKLGSRTSRRLGVKKLYRKTKDVSILPKHQLLYNISKVLEEKK